MIELHWQRSGPPDAPMLVLLNSIGASSLMWQAQLGPLAEHLQVVEVDTRGHGRSPAAPVGSPSGLADLAADVLGVLDQLERQYGCRRVHLAGLSLGGMVALWIAARHPERVDRLIVLCSSAYLPPASGWLDRAATVRAEGTEAVADATIGRWITPELAERDRDLASRLRQLIVAVDDESYAQCCEAIAAMDLRPELARITASTLVIAGAQDPTTPPEHARLIAAGIADSQVRVLSPAAHLAPVEAAGQVSALLLGHLRPSLGLATGERTRREVVGDEHVDRALAAASEFSRPFQDFITRYAWGEVWSRPALSRRERSIGCLSVLVALGAEAEIELHLRAALRNGLTAAEIGEVLLQVAVYAGVPRANRAFAIAERVLADT